MLRHILVIATFLCCQFAFAQDYVYGTYRGTGFLFDSLPVTFHLSLKQDGNYILQNSQRDSLTTETGKWQKKGDIIKLKPGYSKAEKQYRPERTFVLNIDDNILIWKPTGDTQKREKKMSKTVGEKVTLVDKSEPLVLYKED